MRLCVLCGTKIPYASSQELTVRGYLLFFDYQQNSHHYFCPEHTAEEIVTYMTKIIKQEKEGKQ